MHRADIQDLHFDELGEQTVLPDQFFSGRGDFPAVAGERRLMLAVLEDAVNTFQKYVTAVDRRGQTLFREAEEWFMERDTGAVLSLEYIGEALGFDADVLRQGLQKWRDRRLAQSHGIRAPHPGIAVHIMRCPTAPTHEPEELRKAAGA